MKVDLSFDRSVDPAQSPRMNAQAVRSKVGADGSRPGGRFGPDIPTSDQAGMSAASATAQLELRACIQHRIDEPIDDPLAATVESRALGMRFARTGTCASQPLQRAYARQQSRNAVLQWDFAKHLRRDAMLQRDFARQQRRDAMLQWSDARLRRSNAVLQRNFARQQRRDAILQGIFSGQQRRNAMLQGIFSGQQRRNAMLKRSLAPRQSCND